MCLQMCSRDGCLFKGAERPENQNLLRHDTQTAAVVKHSQTKNKNDPANFSHFMQTGHKGIQRLKHCSYAFKNLCDKFNKATNGL